MADIIVAPTTSVQCRSSWKSFLANITTIVCDGGVELRETMFTRTIGRCAACWHGCCGRNIGICVVQITVELNSTQTERPRIIGVLVRHIDSQISKRRTLRRNHVRFGFRGSLGQRLIILVRFQTNPIRLIIATLKIPMLQYITS